MYTEKVDRALSKIITLLISDKKEFNHFCKSVKSQTAQSWPNIGKDVAETWRQYWAIAEMITKGFLLPTWFSGVIPTLGPVKCHCWAKLRR